MIGPTNMVGVDVKSDALLTLSLSLSLSLGVNPLYSFLSSNQSSKCLSRNHFATPPIDSAFLLASLQTM